MKSIWLVFVLVVIGASMGYAQDSTRVFKPFKVGIGVGYAVPGGGRGAGGGALVYLEPAYRASDFVQIGLRLESAFFVRGIRGVNGNNDVSGDAAANLSYTLNAQFYFTDKSEVRGFIGGGLGLYTLAAQKFVTVDGGNNTYTSNIGAETAFGFYPRIGVDAGHFNLTLDYNVIPSTSVPGGGTVRNNYLGIRLGLSLGGGQYIK